jgi:hypothetical protein
MIRAMLIPELAQTRKRGLQAGAKRGRAIAAERSEAALVEAEIGGLHNPSGTCRAREG